jgi:putative phosphoribosyl transferase
MVAPAAPEREVAVDAGARTPLGGTLGIPANPVGVVLFAHGSGSSRFGPRNRAVAHSLQQAGLATLLVDLLTVDEEADERTARHLRFDIGLLAERLEGAMRWLSLEPTTAELPLGLLCSSTGAAAALVAAARDPERVLAVVSQWGRPDLAGGALPQVRARTLFIVGGADATALRLNLEAMRQMRTEAELVVVEGATHLFEEPGVLEQAAQHARRWFLRWLAGAGRERPVVGTPAGP